MHVIITSIVRQLARAGIFGLWLLASASALPDTPSPLTVKKLQDIVAWDAHGLGSGVLTSFVSGNNSFSGKLHLENVPDALFPEVIGFKSDNQRLYNLALIYPGKSLVSLVPALRETPVADLELPQLLILLTPPPNAGASITLPVQVGTVRMPYGAGAIVKLEAGARVLAQASFGGQTAALLQAIGAPSRDLALSGTIDPRVLNGAALKSASLQNELINALDLNAVLRATTSERKPAYLTFGDSVFRIKGVSGKVASGIATSLRVNVGSGVNFDNVTINRDPVKRLITIASSSQPGSNFIALGIDGAAIREIAFHGLIDEQKKENDMFSLAGKYVVGGSTPRDFSATLSGGSPAQYAVSVHADTTLNQLLGWSVPGLDALVIREVSAGNGYLLGKLALKGMNFSVALFKGVGQAKYNAAFLSEDSFVMPKLMGTLQGTPLADLELVQPGFVLVPPENASVAIRLPEPVSHHFGVPALELKQGLNLLAKANMHGEAADLLQSVGLSAANLRVVGNLDPSILSGKDTALSENFLNATSLQLALSAAAPQHKPPYLTFGNSVLLMKGQSGKIATGIASSLHVNVGSGISFDNVTINRDPVKRLIAIASSSMPGGNFISLGIDGAAIREIAFHGLIDEQKKENDKFSLDGKYVVGGSTPRDFSATLSGASPAQFVVTAHADTTLNQLLGWSVPGLDALVVREVTVGNGYTLGKLALQGMNFSVALFKAAGQVKYNAVFLSDDTFGLPKLMSSLQGTPLADLELAHPGFVLVPPENAGVAIKLPAPASLHFGVAAVDLKKGLNVIANGNVYGDLAVLLDKLGINSKGLPIVGTLDPAMLSGVDGATLTQPFLDVLDLRVFLPNFALSGIAHNVTVSNGYLALKGIAKGIDASIAARLAVNSGATVPLVFESSLRLVKSASGNTVSISGTYPGAWNKPFDIRWLDIRNVRIDGTIAQPGSLAVLGTTDVGSVHNLTVEIDLAGKPDGGNEVVLKLSGADVSLADIPALASIPHAGDLKLRDLLVSARAIGGTLKSSKLPLLHEVQAVAFEVAGRWNLAALLGDVDLSRLMTLPQFAQPALGKLKLGKTALVLSQTAFGGRLADLSPPARTPLQAIYGSLDGTLRLVDGVNLVSRFDPSTMGRAVTTFLPAGQTLLLQGSAGGVLGGGPPSLALSATIPALALPPSLGFVKLPANARTAFFINLTETTASSGVEVEAIISARLNKQMVDFDSTIAFEVDNQGGVAVDLQGKSLNPWRNVMGVSGLSLDTGSRIEMKTAATSELTVKFLGKTHIGSRAADVAGSASVLAGVVDKGAFEVKLSELTLSDVVGLFNAAVQAGGGQPLKVDFPDARLTNVDIAFASPGASFPELNLPDGGTRLAGDLWFLIKGKPLSRVKAKITETSLVMSGDLADFTLGPVAMKGNSLDVRAQSMPPLPPQFRIVGAATIMNKHAAAEIDAGLEETAVVSSLDLGGLLNLDLHASFATPAAGLDPAALASQDMALNAHLKSDLGEWLRGAGKKVVSKVFDSLGSDIKKLTTGLEAAKKQVDTLNGQIRKARERAEGGAKTVDQQIVQAQKKVDGLAARVKSLKGDIASQKSDIHGCNYSRSICYWWNWRGHCTKHKDVPDVARDAECEVNNGRHAATLAAYEAALKAAQASEAAAEAVLSGLRKGEKGVDLASLDPEVIALEAALVTADLALKTAETLSKGAELGVDQLASGLQAMDRLDAFKLTGSSISGSLQKAVAGKPVVLGLDFEASGKVQHLRLALSLTDPAYNEKQLATLALLVAKAAIEALPGAAPAVTHLLNDAFKTVHDASEKEVEKAAREHALE